MSTIRARFDGRVLVPVDPVNLPTDRVLELDVRDVADLPKGSPQLLLRLMREEPHIPRRDVEELERAIEEGKQSTQEGGVFDDLVEGGDEK